MLKRLLCLIIISLNLMIGTNVFAVTATSQNTTQNPSETSKPRIQEGNMQNIVVSPKPTQKVETENFSNIDEYIDNKIKTAESNYNNQKEAVKVRIRAMYQNSGSGFLNVLSKSKNVVEIITSMQVISIIAKKDAKNLQQLELSREEYLQCKSLKESIENAKKKDGVNLLKGSYDDLNAELERRKKFFEEQEKLQIKRAQTISNEIIKMMSNAAYAGGTMTWPVPSSSNISSPYGMRYSKYSGAYNMHTGIDITGPVGTPIVAANSGVVILSKYDGSYGNCIIVDHGGGYATLYAHNSSLLASVGQNVTKGQVICKIGLTGNTTGAHLHFEVRVSNSTQNPSNYVKFGV